MIKDSKYLKINSVNSLYLIKFFIPSVKNSDDYDEKYMKIKFNSDDELPLNKAIETPSMIKVVSVVLHENNKYYPQVFLVECLHK